MEERKKTASEVKHDNSISVEEGWRTEEGRREAAGSLRGWRSQQCHYTEGE